MSVPETTPDTTRKAAADDLEKSFLLSAYLPRWLIIAITVLSIILLVACLITGLFWPRWFQHPNARVLLCFLLAFCLAIVMFGVYPQVARIKNVPLIDLPVELVGPLSIFVVALTLLVFIYPNAKPRVGFYVLYERGTQTAPVYLQIESLEIKPIHGRCTYYPVTDLNSKDRLRLSGIYVEFNDDDDCKATIGNAYVHYAVAFNADVATNVVLGEKQTTQ